MARETPHDTLDRWWRVARARTLALLVDFGVQAAAGDERARPGARDAPPAVQGVERRLAGHLRLPPP